MYEISKEMAQELVEFVSGETGFHMNICDKSGMFIGDSRKQRFGTYHPNAVRIMKGEVDSVEVTKEEAEKSDGKLRHGYNCVLTVDGERVGTFGIGGDPEVVKPIAKIASAVISARVKEMQHMDLIREVVAKVSTHVHEVAEVAAQISRASRNLAAAGDTVTRAVVEANEKVKATNTVLDLILQVADQTKLLGLNAAILAAQAGRHGRGFNVVAGEIRSLAANSASSAEDVTKILAGIQAAIADVAASSGQTTTISVEQEQHVERINRVIEDIQNSVNHLVSSVKK